MITSVTNKTIKELVKLKKKKYRDETGLYLVEGVHLVEEALKSGYVKQVITCDNDYQGENVLYVSEPVMEKLAFTKTPQNIMAVCRKNENTLIKGKRYLLLDGVQDPGNVGTMIRSALAFGYDQVILSEDSVDLYNDKVIRSTQGALFHIPIIRMDLKESIRILHQQDTYIVGTGLKNALPINNIDTYPKMAIIMGNEGNGMHEEILSLCDIVAYIPIKTMESLNVAVAAGIMMYTYGG